MVVWKEARYAGLRGAKRLCYLACGPSLKDGRLTIGRGWMHRSVSWYKQTGMNIVVTNVPPEGEMRYDNHDEQEGFRAIWISQSGADSLESFGAGFG